MGDQTAWLLGGELAHAGDLVVAFVDPAAGAHLVEEATGPTERPVGPGLAGGGETAALAEQSVGLLGHLRELLPAVGGIRVEDGGLGVLAGAFRLDRPDGDERVLLSREDV